MYRQPFEYERIDKLAIDLYIHEYKRDNFKDRAPRFMTDEEIKRYKKYLKGVKLS